MSWLSRLRNAFRGERLNRELDEELRAHLEEAAEAGRSEEEARRAFGSLLKAREESRDAKAAVWLESLCADFVFGLRQLRKNRVASCAAILSLGLAIGACMAAFRLVDALLLRPLPVAHADRLFCVEAEYTDREGKKDYDASNNYPAFLMMKDALGGEAVTLAISYASQVDLTYGSDAEMEKAFRQYVSGEMFSAFGLKPAVGRLLTASDDRQPGAHPYAVLSYGYWERRFGRDPGVVGRKLRIGDVAYEIVGVAGRGFTGTETGIPTDLFVPTMMNKGAVANRNWSWFRTWVQLKPGLDNEHAAQRLRAALQASRKEEVKSWGDTPSAQQVADYISARLRLRPASAGVSELQKSYRQAMLALGVLVSLVLLIACANVANLMNAQAVSRAREMALRVSIGAGRGRLLQLVLAESLLLAAAASLLGAAFAWWAAPFVMEMIDQPWSPAQLSLPADWRVAGFGALLALAVTVLFGAVPAWRASQVRPVAALKGGADPHGRRRLMNALVAAQVAFCFLVHFVAGLFVSSFDRLAGQSPGFDPKGVVLIELFAKEGQPASSWEQLRARLAAVNGVESSALTGWPLMSGNTWTGGVWVAGKGPEAAVSYFLSASPGWLEAMGTRLLSGRDFRRGEVHPHAAIVSKAFAETHFPGQEAAGRAFEIELEGGGGNKAGRRRATIEIVGTMEDVRYRDLRERVQPVVLVPFDRLNGRGEPERQDWGAAVVRLRPGVSASAIAPALRAEVNRAHLGFRVSNLETQENLLRWRTVRERLLAMLSTFFAGMALLLAGLGLYGVLDYSVVQRRREIGIRMALGAKAQHIVRRVTAETGAMLALGSAIGLALGVISERHLESLLFNVRATDWPMMAVPATTIAAGALAAAIAPVLRALRLDAASMLRAD